MNFSYKKVFVTGANGWLGRQLMSTFFEDDPECILFEKEKNLKIYCLLRENEDSSFLDSLSKKILFSRGDITKAEDSKSFLNDSDSDSILIHTAGLIHPKRINELFKVNYEGTRNIVNAAINNKLKKIIVISSNSPLGCNKDPEKPFDENSPYNPYMNYGKSKMEMEIFLKEKIHEGHDITILRTPWFYGKNMPDRQQTFYQMIINGRFPFIGDGNNIRSVANVKNIVQGIILASISNNSKGQIYWIADELNLSMKDMVNEIQSVFENEFKIICKQNKIFLPYFIGQIAEFIDYLIQSIGLYNQKIHVLSEMNKNIVCDITKAKKELGYNPKVNFYEGTKEAYKQYLNLNEKI